MIDAPVSGGPAGAEEGTLTCMMGGSDTAVERAKPLMAAFASNARHVGPVGSGHAIKAVNNAFNATHLVLGCQGLLGLRGMGVAPVDALSVINTSSGRSLRIATRR